MQLKALLSVGLVTLLGACSTLPSSGPTGGEVRKALLATSTQHAISIVEVSDATALPPREAAPIMTLVDLAPPPTDMVGSGDVLSISIYEAGVTLFGGGGSQNNPTNGFDSSVKTETLPSVRVDDDGNITLPYAGRLHVLGKTLGEIQSQIRNALRGYSQNPQVLVSMREAIANSVIVSGDVARPGRLVLQTNRETLTDVVALSGGYRGDAKDLLLRITRRNQNMDIRFSDLVADPRLDVRAYPSDRFTVINDPRSYSVLGAAGKVDHLSFSRPAMTLAEAIASAGGTSPTFGDPKAIFVFRYENNTQGDNRPIVYHFNMMKAPSYLLAQKFAMRNGDVLYFGNARANQPTKLVQLVSQLFSPILTVTSAVQVLQNSN